MFFMIKIVSYTALIVHDEQQQHAHIVIPLALFFALSFALSFSLRGCQFHISLSSSSCLELTDDPLLSFPPTPSFVRVLALLDSVSP